VDGGLFPPYSKVHRRSSKLSSSKMHLKTCITLKVNKITSVVSLDSFAPSKMRHPKKLVNSNF
jgi:hypothetical protein